VVDDEEFCIAAMKAILVKCNIDIQNRCDFCISGRESLEQVKKAFINGINYKIILTDFNMPQMDGMEATESIRAFFRSKNVKRKDQPIIIGLTGFSDQKFVNLGLASGMDEVFSKPIYVDKLQEIFRKYQIY